ncbi:MAG: hypothetical protein JXA17_07315 [Dehalococcoidales bacterium]|nr:hypothetical protein [Dehalococcoidales bacterium]
MNDEINEENFDPSMHIVPIDKDGILPFKVLGKDDDKTNGTFFAVTENGRISAFPAKWERVLIGGKYEAYTCLFERVIKSYIDKNYPGGKNSTGKNIKQYLMTCVAYSFETYSKIIFDVVGFPDKSKNIKYLHKALKSLYKSQQFGDTHWKTVEAQLSAEPMVIWINEMIKALKERGWADFVREGLEQET